MAREKNKIIERAQGDTMRHKRFMNIHILEPNYKSDSWWHSVNPVPM